MKLSRIIFAGIWALTAGSVHAAWEILPDQPVAPPNNPQSEAKIELGKMLYFDPRLSKNGVISCNSCHNVMAGGDDNRPNSVGVKDQRGGRGARAYGVECRLSICAILGRSCAQFGRASQGACDQSN